MSKSKKRAKSESKFRSKVTLNLSQQRITNPKSMPAKKQHSTYMYIYINNNNFNHNKAKVKI